MKIDNTVYELLLLKTTNKFEGVPKIVTGSPYLYGYGDPGSPK